MIDQSQSFFARGLLPQMIRLTIRLLVRQSLRKPL